MVFIKCTLSPNVQDHYAHYTYDASLDPLDYCIESAAAQKVKGLKTNEWDLLRGEQVRASFMDGDNLVLAYAACLKLCGKGCLPVKVFHRLISKAGQKNIWSYKGIPLWAIPFILILLSDFTHANGNSIRFSLDKPSKRPLQDAWNSNKYFVEKVFVAPESTRMNGEIKVSKESYMLFTRNTEWMSDSLINKIKSIS